MFQKAEKEVATQIGNYYLQKNNGDYDAARREIESLHIKEINVYGDTVGIHLSRPGLIIGLKAKNINDLQKYLGKTLYIKEVNDIVDYIIQYEPLPFDDYVLPEAYLHEDDLNECYECLHEFDESLYCIRCGTHEFSL